MVGSVLLDGNAAALIRTGFDMGALVISSPATILDMAQLSGARSPLAWSVVREMHAGGETFAARHDGELVALCGLYPLDGGGAEAWFNVAPAAAVHMVAVVRSIRLTLRASRYREIVTVVGRPAGRRIARAAGFTFFETTDTGEVWIWNSSEATRAKNSPSETPKPSSAAA